MMLNKLLYILLFITILIGVVFVSLNLYRKSIKANNLKKKILFSIPTLAYCFIVILITLLFSDSKLNYVEEQVCSRVTSMVNKEGFFNPKEARLLDVVVKYKYSDIDRKYVDTIDTYYVKIIGTNKVGGTINKCYKIYYNDYSQEWNNYDENCEGIYKNGIGYEQLTTKSIKKINKAIQKYWNNLGL